MADDVGLGYFEVEVANCQKELYFGWAGVGEVGVNVIVSRVVERGRWCWIVFVRWKYGLIAVRTSARKCRV
jgi:hypothetical protein